MLPFAQAWRGFTTCYSRGVQLLCQQNKGKRAPFGPTIIHSLKECACFQYGTTGRRGNLGYSAPVVERTPIRTVALHQVCPSVQNHHQGSSGHSPLSALENESPCRVGSAPHHGSPQNLTKLTAAWRDMVRSSQYSTNKNWWIAHHSSVWQTNQAKQTCRWCCSQSLIIQIIKKTDERPLQNLDEKHKITLRGYHV